MKGVQGMPRNNLLRQERLKRGWSQADVAGKIGSDPKTVGRWERGLTSPSPYLCQQLCQLYEKTPEELGLWTVESPEEQAAPDASTPPARADAAAPANTALLARVLKRWPRLRSRPVWMSILGGCVLLVVLSVWVVARVLSPPPPSVSGDPYTGTASLAMSDSLASDLGAWPTDENLQGTCAFVPGGYEIRVIQTEVLKPCWAVGASYRNFVYEARLQIRAGDCGGLIFRGDFLRGTLYYFIICQDGHYRFIRFDNTSFDKRRVVIADTSPKIHEGSTSQPNVVAVVAKGDHFALYVNHAQVGHFVDDAYALGQLGLIAHSCRVTYPPYTFPDLCTAPTDVFFQDVRVWKL